MKMSNLVWLLIFCVFFVPTAMLLPFTFMILIVFFLFYFCLTIHLQTVWLVVAR